MAVTAPTVWEVLIEQLSPQDWESPNRPPLLAHQEPPTGKWNFWLLEGGRGSGKTEACSRYFAKYMRRHPRARGRIIAPTLGDAVEACIEGPSGLRSIDPEIRWLPGSPGGSKVVWPNGSEALVLGTPTPRDVDRLRAGGNRDIDWWEEFAANPMIRTAKKTGDAWDTNAWDQAWFGLRRGEHPHAIGSTTPRMSPKYKEVRGLKGTVITRGTLYDNPYNNPEWRAQMIEIYEGTRLGKQELAGELLEDIEGALWKAWMLQHCSELEMPELIKVIVGVDPSGSASGAECGIVTAGLAKNGNIYVIRDASKQASPGEWAATTIRSYHDTKANKVVAEKNFGGDMVAHTLKTVPAKGDYPPGTQVPVTVRSASRGKDPRAEPVVGLYEQGRVWHVGNLGRLEDQMTTWVPGEGTSPDRVDALVWAVRELAQRGGPARASSAHNVVLPS